MYQPHHFREDRIDVQHALIKAHPLGLLITSGRQGLMANPIPFLIDSTASERGTLMGHLARASNQVADLDTASECLVVFQGPQGYVSPSAYAAKRETGKVVPTWNYATVHAWGRPTVITDHAWLRSQIAALTTAHEATRPKPWSVTDAPGAFVDAQIKGIVGLSIEITRTEGKWKVSQNRSLGDRERVAVEMRAAGEPGRAIADLVLNYRNGSEEE
jgi:transcriptional regulator